VESGSVAAGESSPPPRDAAVIPSWICGRREKPTQAPQSDCHAIAVVEEPDREEMQQFLLIVLGAIGSAGILGFFDGIRRRLAPWE
jgi:hypothetical protein